MAKYTIELKDVVKLGYDIFDFKYDFYDESKRPKFERDFIRHFYFREIGANSVEEFIHNLEDKMLTIFPYYNELFKANKIEYDVLNSYRLTETFETTRNTEANSNGVSSSVGSTFDKQNASATEHRTTEGKTSQEHNGERGKNSSSETETTSNGTIKKTSTTETDTTSSETGNTSGTTSETVKESTEGASSETLQDTTIGTTKSTKKYLDTPQGKLNLDSVDYLTNLTEDTATENKTNNTNKNGTNDTETNRSTTGTNETETENSSTGNSSTTGSENTTTSDTVKTTSESEENETESSNTNGTVSETSEGSSESTFEGEQKNTLDNNTRTRNNEEVTEKHTLTRIGNIGVSPDALDIMKHLELQKIVKSIENLFFKECEDLFMLVF